MQYETNNTVKTFYNNIFQCGVVPLINKTTRVTTFSKIIIDNTISNDYMNTKLKTGIIKTSIPNHSPIFCCIYSKLDKTKSTVEISKRTFNKKNNSKFKQALKDTVWSIIQQCPTVNNQYNLFFDILSSIYDDNFSKMSKIFKTKDLRSPWMTKGMKKSSHEAKTIH